MVPRFTGGGCLRVLVYHGVKVTGRGYLEVYHGAKVYW